MNAVQLDDVSKTFGSYQAVKNVNLNVLAGSRHAILGPNGAGKSTLFNLIAGQTKPSAGAIRIHGEEITGLPPHKLWERGVTRTFQRNQLFTHLSVKQNLRLAALRHHVKGFFLVADARQVDRVVNDTLHSVGLGAHTDNMVSELAYGQQRQLEIALALVGQPKVLLLDEPTAGISPAETESMLGILGKLPKSITIMLVEHDMDVVFALCDRITVLHLGEKIAEGSPAEISANVDVRRIYMGEQA